MGKGENALNQHFPAIFSTLSKTQIIILATYNLSSANALNLVLSKKLSFGKELSNIKFVICKCFQFGKVQNFVVCLKVNYGSVKSIQNTAYPWDSMIFRYAGSLSCQFTAHFDILKYKVFITMLHVSLGFLHKTISNICSCVKVSIHTIS